MIRVAAAFILAVVTYAVGLVTYYAVTRPAPWPVYPLIAALWIADAALAWLAFTKP